MEAKKRMGRDLTTGSVPKGLIAFATPLFLSNLLQAVYNMVDMIVVGKYVGSVGLSAVSIGGDILNMLTFVAMGFSSAGQIIISQYVGAGRKDKVTKLIGTMFTFLLICALTIMVLGMTFHEWVIRLLNTPTEAFADVKSYVLVCLSGLVFIYGYNMVSAVLRGMGDSKHPFQFIATAAIVNLVLDLLFVGSWGMGAMGAALATVIGQAISFISSIVLLYRMREQFGFDFKLTSFRIHKDVFKPMISLGIPMVIQSAAINFSKMFVHAWINSYGVVISAVSGVGNKLGNIVNMFGNAFSTAGGAMNGQSIGAAKYDRVPKVIGTTFVINATVAAIFSAAVFFFPDAVFGVFTDDMAVLEVCREFVPVSLMMFASMSLRSCMMTLINGSGNSKLNLAVAILDGVLARIGLSALFGLVMDYGYMGLWIGGEMASFVPFLIGGTYFLSGNWKKKSKLIAEE
ncbi:MAG: MATE family efflux transporter [Clostridia bacterium]|nr:MATE family efflux transporter [Clostridia bacterium]